MDSISQYSRCKAMLAVQYRLHHTTKEGPLPEVDWCSSSCSHHWSQATVPAALAQHHAIIP